MEFPIEAPRVKFVRPKIAMHAVDARGNVSSSLSLVCCRVLLAYRGVPWYCAGGKFCSCFHCFPILVTKVGDRQTNASRLQVGDLKAREIEDRDARGWRTGERELAGF